MTAFIPWNSLALDEAAQQYSQGKFLELDGISTHYIEKGSGNPLIFLHGFFYDLYMWNKNLDYFAERYKVLAMDLWGFGYSSRKPLDYGYPLYTKQLAMFMDKLGIQRASLVGQSMGAGTIINFAVSNPERVDKIVLVDAAALPNRLPIMGRISNLPKVGEFLYSLNTNFIRKMTLRTTFLHKKEIITDEYFENATRFHKIKGSSEIMLQITRKQFFDTLQPELNKLGQMNLPILIVWGRQDRSIPVEIGKQMHQILVGSQLEIIDQAGHCPHDDQSERFNPLVLEFLS